MCGLGSNICILNIFNNNININIKIICIQVEGQCVVLVGTTGTGKTTCLNIYTGQVVIMMAMVVYCVVI